MSNHAVENIAFTQTSEPKSLGAAMWLRIRAAFSEVNIHRRPRRLKLCETLSLGEKRIVVLIECENQRFLIAATPQNITLLQTLSAPTDQNREEDRQSEQS